MSNENTENEMMALVSAARDFAEANDIPFLSFTAFDGSCSLYTSNTDSVNLREQLSRYVFGVFFDNMPS